jgi:hypothetical protein
VVAAPVARLADSFHDRNVSATIVRRQLLAGTLALLGFRILLSLFRSGPLLVADEIGYRTNARVLAGGVPGQLSEAPFYRGGYSLLLAPLLGVEGNPETAYHLVLVLNAILACSLAPLVYLLLTRSFQLAPRVALWPSLAAAAYPSVTVFSQVALSENLLMPLTVVWALCFGCLVQARQPVPRMAWTVACAGCAVALFAVHGRMIVAVALTLLAFVLLTIRRRLQIEQALVGAAVVAGGLVAVRRLDDYLVSRNYGGNHPDEAGERLSNLDDVHGVLSFARNLVGHSWYLIVATLGIVVLYLVADGVATLRRSTLRGAGSAELVLVLLLALGLGLLVVSALSFRTPDRPDMLVYGRYVEVVVPPLLAIALGRLATTGRLPPVAKTVAVLSAATAVVVLLRTTIHPAGGPNRWNIASLPFLTLTLGELPLVGAGAVALGVAVALAAVTGRRPALLAPIAAALLLPTTAVVLNNPVFAGQRSFYPAGWTSPGAAAPDATAVAFDTDHHGSLYVYQWFMPHAHFVLFSARTGSLPARYVFSSRAWGSRHPRLYARRLWIDPGRDSALFEVRQPPHPTAAGALSIPGQIYAIPTT